MTAFTTGPAGMKLIERNEGCVLHTYLDIRGIPTIGWGITGPEAWAGRVITQEQADQMLADRLKHEFEPGVNALLGSAPTTQHQFDAMISLSYNIGVAGFARSSVLRDHLGGREIAEKGDFEKWDMAGGRELDALLRRRDEEFAVYNTPDDADPDVVSAPHPASPAPANADKQCAISMQAALKLDGLYKGALDGVWGAQSQGAFATLLSRL